MSNKLQITFPKNPIIVKLGADHSTVIHNGRPINLASIKALGCEVSESSDLLYKWGDFVGVWRWGELDYKATYIASDHQDRRFAVVQDEESGTIAKALFSSIKHINNIEKK